MEKDEHVNYWDWFDHGPGSEQFKREVRRGMSKPLDFPFFSNPSTTPEEVCVSCKKRPTIQVMLTNSAGQTLVVADIDPNEKYWEVDVPKRKQLIKLINGIFN